MSPIALAVLVHPAHPIIDLQPCLRTLKTNDQGVLGDCFQIDKIGNRYGRHAPNLLPYLTPTHTMRLHLLARGIEYLTKNQSQYGFHRAPRNVLVRYVGSGTRGRSGCQRIDVCPRCKVCNEDSLVCKANA